MRIGVRRWEIMSLAALLAIGLILFLCADAHAQIGSRVVVEPDEDGYSSSGAAIRLLERIFSIAALLAFAVGVLVLIMSREQDSPSTKQTPKTPERNDRLTQDGPEGEGQTLSSSPPITNDLARWSALGTRLYDKVDHKLYRYRLQHGANLIEVLDETSKKAVLYLHPERIDVIKISNGIARVKCPKCMRHTSEPVKTWVQIKCPKCKFVWQQHLVTYEDE